MIELKQIVSMVMMVVGVAIIFTSSIHTNTTTEKILVLILGSIWLVSGITYGDKEK